MAESDDFEREYLERANRATAGLPIDAIWLDRDIPFGLERAIAGWWCAETAAERVVVLPNPWDDRRGIALMDEWCWRAAQRVIAQLTPGLDELHGGRGIAYWEALLAPILVHIVSAVADRRLFLLAAADAAPGAPVIAPSLGEPPATMAAAVGALRDPRVSAALMGEMASALGLAVSAQDQSPRPTHDTVDPPVGVAGRAKRALREPRQSARLVLEIGGLAVARRALAATGRRRVTVVGHSGLNSGNVLSLGRAVRGLRVVSAVQAPAGIAAADRALRERLLAQVVPGDDLERLTLAVLGYLLPRSVLEGFDATVRSSLRGYGPATNTVAFGHAIDEVQNEYLARCAASGRRLEFAQHGGFYMQAAVNAQERLEVRAGSQFWSWGAEGPGVRPVPTPRLERIRGTHVGGDVVTLVEGVHPPDSYVLRFASTPLGNQVYDGPLRLAALVEASSSASRNRMRLKRFPAVIGGAPRLTALATLSTVGPEGARTAVDWMRSSRLVVVSYPDTPFLEALVVGAPTVGLWNPAHWEWREDLVEVVSELHDVGIVFADPVAAAAHVDAVLGQGVEAWWNNGRVAAARARLIDRLAARGNWRDAWVAGLRDLSGS